MSSTAELLASSSLSKLDDIERDIGDLIQMGNRALHIVPDDHLLPNGPMPDYVEHKEGVSRVGKLSAEAVVREYDAAVKEIEALGAELTEAAKKCESMVADVHATVNEIKELAADYREEGKRYFMQIEECSLTTSEVRSVCDALKKKIAARIAA
jgi:hypothetical protein